MPTLLATPPALGAPVDWGHPIARGLMGYWPGNEGAGSLIPDAALGNSGLGIDVARAYGAWNFNGSTSAITVATHARYEGPYATQSIWFRTTDSATRRGLFGHDAGSGNRGVLVGIDSFDSRGLFCASGAMASIELFVSSGPTVWDGKWHHGVAAYSLLSGVMSTLWVDGRVVISTPTTGTTAVAGDQVNIGRSGDGFWALFTGDARNAAWWDRILSTAEVMQLYREPWCLLRGPDRWRRYFIMPAALVISGTATAGIDEDDIVAGGKTIIATLNGYQWPA